MEIRDIEYQLHNGQKIKINDELKTEQTVGSDKTIRATTDILKCSREKSNLNLDLPTISITYVDRSFPGF